MCYGNSHPLQVSMIGFQVTVAAQPDRMVQRACGHVASSSERAVEGPLKRTNVSHRLKLGALPQVNLTVKRSAGSASVR
jgi:hypothetical protein